jgi:hypothetical protein
MTFAFSLDEQCREVTSACHTYNSKWVLLDTQHVNIRGALCSAREEAYPNLRQGSLTTAYGQGERYHPF